MGNPRRQRISMMSGKGKPPMAKMNMNKSIFKGSECET